MAKQMERWMGLMALLLMAAVSATDVLAAGAMVETEFVKLELSPETGGYQITDKLGGVVWQSNPFQRRFGQVTVVLANGKKQIVDLAGCQVQQVGQGITAVFSPLVAEPARRLTITVIPQAQGKALEFSYQVDGGLVVDGVRLLDEAFSVGASDAGYVVIPVREGLLIPADNNVAFNHPFDTYNYEGCHMAMVGVVKKGAAVLLSWDDPYTIAHVRSTLPGGQGNLKEQTLSLSMSLRKSARACTVHFLGKGDYVDIAKAYRQVAAVKGMLVKWDQKVKENPERAKLFGASNIKLWSTLSRQMNDASTAQVSARVSWTFDEAAAVAEHMKNDLKIDRSLFTIGGWIRRGYDNQHPDILPAAPECGGDAKLAQCAKRVMDLGYLFCLHDNYQDMYKDSPSWDESYLQRSADGAIAVGGKWAGGRAYLTCSQRAVDLAKRPQNLAAVKKLTNANSYFIDTTYAAGLQECFDAKHPLNRGDDMKCKQELSDYGRQVFGVFGSECGREWAIPHADFFEGLTGVSGTYYHNAALTKELGATVVPLFEMVYRDGIAMYGKYGYDANKAAEYVLHHISIGRPLNYHSIPSHLYWKNTADAGPLALRPMVADLKQTGPRQFAISYRWAVEKTPSQDWRIFIHFVDAQGKIRFQNDYQASQPTSQWKVGELRHGPFTVTVPANLEGDFQIAAGLFDPAASVRAKLPGTTDKESRCILGKLSISGQTVQFTPPAPAALTSAPKGDAAMFVRADNGWTDGMHPMDRFLKNTHEILSPLNEITSQVPMTGHRFLSADRLVRRSVFGQGDSAVVVVVNGQTSDYTYQSPAGGKVVLPTYGFVVESPTFLAFCASSWNGVSYDTPTLFTVRSLDEKPIATSTKVRIFHGFGDTRLKLAAMLMQVEKEQVLTPK